MEQFEKELTENFADDFSDKEDTSGFVFVSNTDIKNWLLMKDYKISFRRFNLICGNACLGRTTGNKYCYSIKLLDIAIKENMCADELINDSVKRFRSQSGLSVINNYGNKLYWSREYRLIFELLSKDTLRLFDVFTGSGILALLGTDYFSNIYMNDRDNNLINFHRTMAGNEKDYRKLVSYIVANNDITKERFRELESEFTERKYYRKVECIKAAKFFLLREFAWNAVGGYKKKTRDLKKVIPNLNHVRLYYKKLSGITNSSFVKFLTPIINDPQAVIICDPPYLLDLRYAKREQYDFEFTEENHRQLLRIIRNAQARIILCCYVDVKNLKEDLYYDYLLQSKYTIHKWNFIEFVRKSKDRKSVV